MLSYKSVTAIKGCHPLQLASYPYSFLARWFEAAAVRLEVPGTEVFLFLFGNSDGAFYTVAVRVHRHLFCRYEFDCKAHLKSSCDGRGMSLIVKPT